jgi:hypothetical protein
MSSDPYNKPGNQDILGKRTLTAPATFNGPTDTYKKDKVVANLENKMENKFNVDLEAFFNGLEDNDTFNSYSQSTIDTEIPSQVSTKMDTEEHDELSQVLTEKDAEKSSQTSTKMDTEEDNDPIKYYDGKAYHPDTTVYYDHVKKFIDNIKEKRKFIFGQSKIESVLTALGLNDGEPIHPKIYELLMDNYDIPISPFSFAQLKNIERNMAVKTVDELRLLCQIYVDFFNMSDTGILSILQLRSQEFIPVYNLLNPYNILVVICENIEKTNDISIFESSIRPFVNEGKPYKDDSVETKISINDIKNIVGAFLEEKQKKDTDEFLKTSCSNYIMNSFKDAHNLLVICSDYLNTTYGDKQKQKEDYEIIKNTFKLFYDSRIKMPKTYATSNIVQYQTKFKQMIDENYKTKKQDEMELMSNFVLEEFLARFTFIARSGGPLSVYQINVNAFGGTQPNDVTTYYIYGDSPPSKSDFFTKKRLENLFNELTGADLRLGIMRLGELINLLSYKDPTVVLKAEMDALEDAVLSDFELDPKRGVISYVLNIQKPNTTKDDLFSIDKNIIDGVKNFEDETKGVDFVNITNIDYLKAKFSGKSPQDIPLYFVCKVGRKADHMVTIIVVNQKVYSVGFGYFGGVTAEHLRKQQYFKFIPKKVMTVHIMGGALYTFDYLLQLFVGFKYPVVDFGIFTGEMLEKLSEYVASTTNLSVTLGINLYGNSLSNNEEIIDGELVKEAIKNNKATGCWCKSKNSMGVPSNNDLIINYVKKNCGVYVSQSILYGGKINSYHEFCSPSRKQVVSSEYLNCTAFLPNLIGRWVECGATSRMPFLESLLNVVMPSLCKNVAFPVEEGMLCMILHYYSLVVSGDFLDCLYFLKKKHIIEARYTSMIFDHTTEYVKELIYDNDSKIDTNYYIIKKFKQDMTLLQTAGVKRKSKIVKSIKKIKTRKTKNRKTRKIKRRVTKKKNQKKYSKNKTKKNRK